MGCEVLLELRLRAERSHAITTTRPAFACSPMIDPACVLRQSDWHVQSIDLSQKNDKRQKFVLNQTATV